MSDDDFKKKLEEYCNGEEFKKYAREQGFKAFREEFCALLPEMLEENTSIFVNGLISAITKYKPDNLTDPLVEKIKLVKLEQVTKDEEEDKSNISVEKSTGGSKKKNSYRKTKKIRKKK